MNWRFSSSRTVHSGSFGLHKFDVHAFTWPFKKLIVWAVNYGLSGNPWKPPETSRSGFQQVLGFFYKKTLFRNKKHKTIFKIFISEKLSKQFCFLPSILPVYVAHENFKEFLKNAHFENMRVDFLRMCQNSLRQTDDAFAGMTIFFCCYYGFALDSNKIFTH